MDSGKICNRWFPSWERILKGLLFAWRHMYTSTHQTWKYSLDEYVRYESPPKPRSNFIKKMHSNSVSLAGEFPFCSMSYNFLISALLRCARHRAKECNQNAGHWVNFPSIIWDSLDLNLSHGQLLVPSVLCNHVFGSQFLCPLVIGCTGAEILCKQVFSWNKARPLGQVAAPYRKRL